MVLFVLNECILNTISFSKFVCLFRFLTMKVYVIVIFGVLHGQIIKLIFNEFYFISRSCFIAPRNRGILETDYCSLFKMHRLGGDLNSVVCQRVTSPEEFSIDEQLFVGIYLAFCLSRITLRKEASWWPRCQRICMCRSHQSVAILLGRSCMCLEKTLTQQLQATGVRGWGDTTPCTVNWCKKSPGCLISFELLYGLSEFRCQ